MTHRSTRRTALATGAAALAAGCVGCSKYGEKKSSESSPPPASPASPASPTSSPSAAAGQELARTSDIPVGGGTIFKDKKIVVTQPNQNEFKAFSAICTHMGCTVNKVADGTIDCPCHGSKFHIADGSVAHGPATRPLPAENIKVEGQSIRLA
ncbi:Rieske (2Fe-2S) protein [Streptomyces sp. NPDC086549]|uniref:Rieske (2Fe-2S) protein n=1 Tax=Streptomyces sp. NPDC086549 TaxID=3365752 RepID=UPI003821D743